jgi:hypothetical protein
MPEDRLAGARVDEDGVSLDAIRLQRVGVRVALDGLERAVAAPASGRAAEWTATLRERAQALREAFTHHVVVTEAAGGLFDEVVSEAPRLANQVSKLRDDHLSIADLLLSLATPDPDVDTDDLRDQAIDVMGRIVKHRNSGSGLLYDAYCVDIDAAD